MIKNGLSGWIIDIINGAISGIGGVSLGSLNETDVGASETAIFAVTAHTIDPEKDPAMMKRISREREIYIYAILIFGALLAIYLILQAVDPEDAAEILETVTGKYGYVAVSDMAKFYINTCLWLVLGMESYFGVIKGNNILVEGQMLSILDHVAFSSDNVGLYVTMFFLWLFSTAFFAFRLVDIIITSHIWYFNGIGLAIKKSRWAAILLIIYQAGIILSQFVIVWTCCIVLEYTTSTELSWYSVSFIYLGLFLVVVVEELAFLTWPIVWKLLSPKTLSTAISLARFI